MSDKPHIIILMPDQLRADCLSCAGHPIVRTPNIDALAAAGVRFEKAYTTSPLCMPARSSLASGLFCHNHGQWGNEGQLPADADTYMRRLRAAGYHTCHLGKSHLYSHIAGDHLDKHKPYLHALGFDDITEITGPLATELVDSAVTDRWKKLGCLDTFRDDYARRRALGAGMADWPSPMPPGETLDDFVGRSAVEYVQAYDRDEPLMMFVGFSGPHDPWDAPRDWAAKYENLQMDQPLPMDEPPPWLPAGAADFQRNLQKANPKLTPEIIARTRALYYAKIGHVDDWIGRILQALETRNMLDNAVVILWSDHGEMLWDKGRVNKAVFYESSVRIPLIIRTPRSARLGEGKVADGLVSLTDLYPTMLELACCDPKPDAFGRSLAPMLRDPSLRLNDAVFSEIQFKIPRRTMIRDDRFKMVVDANGQTLKLFDLQDDPREQINLVGKEGMADTIARLRDSLLQWHLATPNLQIGKSSPKQVRF